ncbi:MAG: hypothetical protein H6918_07410 [Sphingomonadaceae bacterium]|nr:hypothetical protein [Sphingomonadaceae bacterium]
MRFISMALLPLLALAASLSAQEGDGNRLDRVSAHFFYKDTGELSDNLLEREDFAAWNTIIGDGENGPADDVLVVATITGPQEDYINDTLELWVTGENGKVIGQRRFDGMLLTSAGSVSSPLWLADATCAGELTIHARFRGKEKTARLQLYCGE